MAVFGLNSFYKVLAVVVTASVVVVVAAAE